MLTTDDIGDYNETYVSNPELRSMIRGTRDNPEMQAKFKFKSQRLGARPGPDTNPPVLTGVYRDRTPGQYMHAEYCTA